MKQTINRKLNIYLKTVKSIESKRIIRKEDI